MWLPTTRVARVWGGRALTQAAHREHSHAHEVILRCTQTILLSALCSIAWSETAPPQDLPEGALGPTMSAFVADYVTPFLDGRIRSIQCDSTVTYAKDGQILTQVSTKEWYAGANWRIESASSDTVEKTVFFKDLYVGESDGFSKLNMMGRLLYVTKLKPGQVPQVQCPDTPLFMPLMFMQSTYDISANSSLMHLMPAHITNQAHFSGQSKRLKIVKDEEADGGRYVEYVNGGYNNPGGKATISVVLKTIEGALRPVQFKQVISAPGTPDTVWYDISVTKYVAIPCPDKEKRTSKVIFPAGWTGKIFDLREMKKPYHVTWTIGKTTLNSEIDEDLFHIDSAIADAIYYKNDEGKWVRAKREAPKP